MELVRSPFHMYELANIPTASLPIAVYSRADFPKPQYKRKGWRHPHSPAVGVGEMFLAREKAVLHPLLASLFPC